MSILPNNFNFHICGVDEVLKYEDKFITDIIAFSHPGNQWDANYDKFNLNPKIRRFLVHDVFDKDAHPLELTWPNERLIKKVIEVCKDIKTRVENGDRVECLVHCQAGISRSTAGAFILLCTVLDKTTEVDCINEIYQKRFIMRPNPLMVEIADKLMGREGKMSKLVECRNKKQHNENNDILLF